MADADATGGDLATADDSAAAFKSVGTGLQTGADAALVERFVADAPGGFEAVVAAYEERITRLAHRLLGWQGRSNVEDVVQDVFFAAFQDRRRFRADASLGTWLTAITVNRCRSQHRRSRLRRILLLRRAREAAPLAPAASGAAEAGEAASGVRAAVRGLPPRDREVIVLRYFEGLSAAEIAAVTKQSANAVEVRLHRARAKLAAALGPLHREE